MTRKEIISILAVLRAAFPNFDRDMGRKELEGIVSLWEDLFRDDPANLVCGAVKALIATKENSFPPTIGEVKAKMQKILSPHEMTEQEAWALVSKALTNGYYGAKEEFAKLPPAVQAAVGDPEQLREWAAMDRATVQSVVASNFQRSYRDKAKHEREFAALPEEVKSLSRSVAALFQPPEVAYQEKPPALPQKVRTREDILRDIAEIKSDLAKVEEERKFQRLDSISDQEWEENRATAKRRLMEMEETV